MRVVKYLHHICPLQLPNLSLVLKSSPILLHSHLSTSEPFKTWYEIHGQRSHVSDPAQRPLVILHRGPGIPYDYLLPPSFHSLISPILIIPLIFSMIKSAAEEARTCLRRKVKRNSGRPSFEFRSSTTCSRIS